MFCRIYVNGYKVRKQFLLFQLCDLFKEKPKDNSYIENDIFSISVSKNDEYNAEKAKAFPEGFIHFPLSIEIEIHFMNEVEASVIINKILNFLWSNNYSAIASCKFEHLLTEKGGYKSKIIPWIVK
jgi:hypothetical protein